MVHLEDSEVELRGHVDLPGVLQEGGNVLRHLSVLHPALLGPVVDVDVGLVDDLLLNDLLNDVLEGDKADRLVERVPFAGSVDILELKGQGSEPTA